MQGKSRGLNTNRTKLHPPHCPSDLFLPFQHQHPKKKPRRRQTSSHPRPHLSTSPHSFLFLVIIALTDPSLFPGSITLFRLLLASCQLLPTHTLLWPRPVQSSRHTTSFLSTAPFISLNSSIHILRTLRSRTLFCVIAIGSGANKRSQPCRLLITTLEQFVNSLAERSIVYRVSQSRKPHLVLRRYLGRLR